MSDKVTTGGVSPRADKIFKIIITVLALVMCFIQIGKYISIGGKPIVNMYYLRIYALHYMFGMLFAACGFIGSVGSNAWGRHQEGEKPGATSAIWMPCS